MDETDELSARRAKKAGGNAEGMFPHPHLHDQEAEQSQNATSTPDLLRFSSSTVSLSSRPPFALIRHNLSRRANARNWTPGQPSISSIYGWTKVRYPIYLMETRSVRLTSVNAQAVGDFIQFHLHQ
jgi:hypothetical protein